MFLRRKVDFLLLCHIFTPVYSSLSLPLLLVFTYVCHYFVVFTYVHSCIFTCLHLFTRVYQCLPLFTRACPPMITHVYLFTLFFYLFTPVHSCFSVYLFISAYSCLPVYHSFCLPMFTTVYSSIFTRISYVYHIY